MSVTPNDILEKRFERSFRGYDEDQVDAFLDAVKEELENKIEENNVLCNQIVGFEEETQDLKLKLTEKNNEAPDEEGKASEIVETAKQTADKYIAEAKQTAENIIVSANKKAEEAIEKASEKIKSLYAQAVSANKAEDGPAVDNSKAEAALGNAKLQAEELMVRVKQEAKALIAKAKTYAETIMQEAEEKANTFYQKKIDDVNAEIEQLKETYKKEAIEAAAVEAEDKAKEIIERAAEKAEQMKNVMNIQIANAQKRLEDIHSAVETYKAKLESFVQSQTGFLNDFTLDDGTDPGEGMNQEALAGLTSKMAQDAEEAGGLGIEQETIESQPESESSYDRYDHVLGKITGDIKSEDADDAAEQEDDGSIPVEKLVTMADDAPDESAAEPDQQELSFSESERKELEDLLDELL